MAVTPPVPPRAFAQAAAVCAAATAVRVALLVFQPWPLSVDEAQYWTWAQAPAFGYFSKPPLLAWLIAGTTALCGDGEACVRLAAPFLHLATALLLFALGSALFGARAGFWSAVTYIFLPGVAVSAMVISTDAPLLLCWAAALLCLLRARGGGGRGWWAGLGLAVGLGLLGKYTMAFFPLCAAVYALWSRERRESWRGGWTAALVAGLVYLPNLLWNAEAGFASYGHTLHNMNLDGALLNPGALADFFAEQFGVFGPVTFAALLAAAWTLLRRGGPDDRYRFLLSFTVPVLAAILAQALLSRAYANWAAPAYLAGTVLTVGWLLRAGRAVWLRLALAVHLLAAAVAPNLALILDGLGVPMRRSWDLALRLRGWDAAGAWASGFRALHPGVRFLFDDRVTMATLMYYVTPHPLDAVMWNPRGLVQNHYEMTTDPMRHLGEDFIYVTRGNWVGAPSPAFAGTRPLGVFQVSDYPGHLLRLEAYYLRGFRGYAP